MTPFPNDSMKLPLTSPPTLVGFQSQAHLQRLREEMREIQEEPRTAPVLAFLMPDERPTLTCLSRLPGALS